MAILKQKVGTVAEERTIVANYDDSTVVHKSGNETVAGIKTFTESPIAPTVTDIDDATMRVATTKFVQDVALEKGGRVSSDAGNVLERKDDGLAVIVSPDSDNLIEKSSNGLKVATKIIPVSGNSGTLSEVDLATLKADERAMLEKDSNLVLHYVGTDDENKMRYTVVTKHTEDDEYVLSIYVDATTGDWEFKYKRMYVCRFPNVPPTTVSNPSGVTGPFFYTIVNDLLHLQWDGVSVASAGTLYVWSSFPSQYLPKQSKQQCTVGIDFNNGYSNCFLYINPTGVRMKAWRANTAYWGSLTLHLEF